MGTHGSKLGQRSGAAKIIKCTPYLFVTTLEDSEDVQIALMMTLGGVSSGAVDFSKNALAKPLQYHWSHLSQQLPIGFFDLARHNDSWSLTTVLSHR
jgi:hypothetical protein